MRKSFDALSGLVRNNLGNIPTCGEVFIFINKRRDKIKLLHWKGSGYLSKEQHADWCLLVTQARDKNYIQHTSDSLISVCL